MNIKRGFISFSNNWNSSIMWGHYSDNYKGICLGYTLNTDAQKNVKGIEYIHKKVNFPYNLESSNNKTINKYYESILHKKQAKWTYENEYRLNLPLIDKDPETGLYFLYLDPKIKLTEIYLGTKSEFTPYDIGGFLIRINYPNNILIYKTTPSMNTFDMEIKYSTKNDLLEYIPNEGCFEFTL